MNSKDPFEDSQEALVQHTINRYPELKAEKGSERRRGQGLLPPIPIVMMRLGRKFLMISGLRHLALKVIDLPRSQAFYERLFGMQVVWQPDPENIYLSSGTDNLALHQLSADELPAYQPRQGQFLDHFGFLMESPESVDGMYQRVQQEGVTILKPPKKHRDGSYSFYLADPDDNIIQVLYEPAAIEGKR